MSDSKKTNNKSQYSVQYAKDNYKRIPLDVRFEDYEKIKKVSKKSNDSINGFIKKAINEKIERDS